MSGENKVDSVEKEKRVYQVSLLLRRKPLSFIIEYIRKNWGLEKAQAYNYIKLARNEWKKYFTNLKHAGVSYHVTQMRDLKDQAFIEKDTRLVLDIAKEEAKLMGIYPAEKHEETRKVIILGAKKEKEKEKDDEAQ